MAAGINAFEIFAKIGADSSGLKSGLDKAKGIVSGFGSIAKKAFSTLGSFVTNIFSGLVRSVKNFFSEARGKAAEFEQAMAQVAATMGKTIDEVNAEIATVEYRGETFTGNLKEYAMQLGATTKFTSTQVAEAMNYMALAGYDTLKTMEMLPTVLNLAAAGGMELGRASDVVTDVQTAFGASTERTTQMIDEMAKAASTGNTSVAQLGDAFLTIGGLAKEVGNGFVKMSDGTIATTDNIQELEIALVAMANAGVKGSEAGMHMRNMLLKLASPTESGTLKLQELGVAVFNSSGAMRSLHEIFADLNNAFKDKTSEERLSAISSLFNARDTASAQALLAAISNTSWDRIGESVLHYEGAAEKMSNTMLNTMQGATELFKSAWDNFQITIANAVGVSGGNLASIVRFGADAVSELTEGFKNNGLDGLIESFITELGKVIDKIGSNIPQLIRPITKFITMIIRKVPKIITTALPSLISALGSVFTEIFSALTDSTFQKNLTAALKNFKFLIRNYFEKNHDDILETGKFIFGTIIDGLVSAAEFIGENLIPVITSIASALTGESGLIAIVDAATDIIKALLRGFFSEKSLDALNDEENGAPKIIVNLIKAITNALTALIDCAADIIGALCRYLTNQENQDQLDKGARDVLDALGDSFEAFVTHLNDGVLAICSYIVESIIGEIDYDTTASEIFERLGKALWNAIKYAKPSGYNQDVQEAFLREGTGTFDEYKAQYEQERREYIDKHPLRYTFFGYDPFMTMPGTTSPRDKRTDALYGEVESEMRRRQLERSALEAEIEAEEAAELEHNLLEINRNVEESKKRKIVSDFVERTGIKGVPVGIFGDGGIVSRPTLALIGEDGAEAVVPLTKKSQVGRQLGLGDNGGITINFGNIYVQGGKNAGQEVVKQIDEALRVYQIQQDRGTGGTGTIRYLKRSPGDPMFGRT